jgi:hypothetical protein
VARVAGVALAADFELGRAALAEFLHHQTQARAVEFGIDNPAHDVASCRHICSRHLLGSPLTA